MLQRDKHIETKQSGSGVCTAHFEQILPTVLFLFLFLNIFHLSNGLTAETISQRSLTATHFHLALHLHYKNPQIFEIRKNSVKNVFVNIFMGSFQFLV